MTPKFLVARKPCGCAVSVLVVKSRDGYQATMKEISKFYDEVHKKTTRKKNPIHGLTMWTTDTAPSLLKCSDCMRKEAKP